MNHFDNHIEAFLKVFNGDWKGDSNIKIYVDKKIDILTNSYTKSTERHDWVFHELLYRYWNGGYYEEYNPIRSSIMNYVLLFINTKLMDLLRERKRLFIYENELSIGDRKKFRDRRKSKDIYDKSEKADLAQDYIEDTNKRYGSINNNYEDNLIDILDKKRSLEGE